MEPKKLTMGELKKMEQGKIPMTEEGERQLTKWKETLNNMPRFGELMSTASKSLIFPQPIPIPTFIPEIFNSNQALKSFAAQMESHKEAMRLAITSLKLDILPPVRIELERVGEIFRRIEADPVLKTRFKLLAEKQRLIYKVIDKWKGHLIHRIEYMPYEPFANQFEFACYALLDDARNNDELDAIVDKNFLDALLDVAARIKIEAKLDFERRERAQQKLLKSLIITNSPNSFTALFNDPHEVSEMVNILREVTQRLGKPIIDDTGKWIKRRGGISILIAWIEVLETRSKFKFNLEDAKMAELLNNHFPGLTLDTKDASIWRKITNIRNKYHPEFLQLIK